MSELQSFPEPAVFAHVDPQLLIDYFEQFKGEAAYFSGESNGRPGHTGTEKYELEHIERYPHLLQAASVILDPVNEKLGQYFGVSIQDIPYETVNFDKTTVQPGSVHIQSAAPWHTDGSNLFYRIDTNDGSEHLTGSIPEAFIEEVVDLGILASDEAIDFERLGDAMEEEGFSDEDLRSMGVAWKQPPAQTAYALTKDHIHRSPRNSSTSPITRYSFQVVFTNPVGS